MISPHPLIAIALSLASAVSFGVAAAVQHAEAGRVEQRAALDPALLGSLLRRPIWLLGVGGDVVGVLLQLAALRYGAVALVQPLLVASLPVAVLLSSRWVRRSPGARELWGLGLCTGGLALLGPATATTTLGRSPGPAEVTAAGVLVAVLATGLLLARRVAALRGPATGLAAGVVIGSGSVLLSVCATRLNDPLALLRTPIPYAAVALGLIGLLLSQAAFQTGSLGAPLAALSVSEPLTAVLLAVVVLHEHLPGGWLRGSAVALGAVAAAAGVLALSQSRSLAPVSA